VDYIDDRDEVAAVLARVSEGHREAMDARILREFGPCPIIAIDFNDGAFDPTLFPTTINGGKSSLPVSGTPLKYSNGKSGGTISPYQARYISSRTAHLDGDERVLAALSLPFIHEGSANIPPNGAGRLNPPLGSTFQPAREREGDNEFRPTEIVIDSNGQPRHAGASMPEGEWLKRYKKRAEESLFVFLKGVLGRFFLTDHFHRDACHWLQKVPPFRKLKLMPREHGKCCDKYMLTRQYSRGIVSSTDKNGRIKEDTMITQPNGIKSVYRVVTTSGREFLCTGNHPFLRWESDWVSIDDGLSIGDWIGVVKKGVFGKKHSPLEAAVCGWMVADGDFVSSRMTAKDGKERDLFASLVTKLGYKTVEYVYSERAGFVAVKKAKDLWGSWGLYGHRSADKFAPDFVLQGDEETVRAFLYELIRHDGTKSVVRNTTGRAIEYTTISERLAFDVQHLLIKFGLHPKLRRETGVRINGKDYNDYKYFRINFTDYAGIVYEGKLDRSDRCVIDQFPPQWRERIPKGGVSLRLKHGIRVDNKYASTRRKVRKVAEIIKDSWLLGMCDSDIGWESVVKIEYLGERETTSVQTENHTLTFGDIITHNTTIVSGGLPTHILIQPAETNIYFPGLEGSECRILMAGETANMAQKNLRVVKSVFTENRVFRAFWPDRCWENARDSAQWNNDGIIIPRKNEWPDPTIRAVGVGGAITGARPNVMIKDDLVTFDAAHSEVVMTEAIEWHKASRALLDKYEIESGLESLEFIIGCLTKDSMITMSDGTKKRICDIKAGEFVYAPDDNGNGAWRKKVSAVIPQGKAETWAISTNTHDLKATGNHPFLISVGKSSLGWRRADQLQIGDLIVAHKSLYSYDCDTDFEPEFCWLFGFMLGDGWVNNRPKKGYVCFSPGIDEKLNERVLNDLKQYVPCNKLSLTKGGYYRTDSVAAAKFFVDLGFEGSAKTKRIPDWVYRLPKESKIQFLRGFCDADGGWQNHQTWRVEISNKELLEDLRHIACICGVRTGRFLTRERVVQPPNSKYPIRSICHSASFNFSTIERTQSVNKNLYGGLNVWRDTKLDEDLRFERVVDVVRTGIVEEVWDLTVEDEHSFFANGLAVHNTRWSVYDLYSEIIDHDSSVEVNDERFHRIIRDGEILWKEKYSLADIEQLQREHKANFYLLYLNNASDPELTDFDASLIRDFTIVGGQILFEEDERDMILLKRYNKGKIKDAGEKPLPKVERGERLTETIMNRIAEASGRGVRIRGV